MPTHSLRTDVKSAGICYAGNTFFDSRNEIKNRVQENRTPAQERLAQAQTEELFKKPIPDSIKPGAKTAVVDCVKLQKGEKVVIITDREAILIGRALKEECEKISPGNVKLFVMEDFGARPEDGSKPLQFPAEIAEVLKNADVSFYAAGCKKGEYPSFRSPMLEIVEKVNKEVRHAHMPGVNEEIMVTGMRVEYKKIQELSQKVYDIVKDAKEIRVTSESGTDFVAEFNPEWKWIKDDGNIKPGIIGNLPDGEVFTCAYAVQQGKMVIDGCLGDCLDKFGSLKKTPVTLYIEDSKVIKTECENKKILEELNNYIKQDAHAARIMEFAIGTNIGLDKFIGNSLQDEKFPGVHISLGSGGILEMVADKVKLTESTTHLDAVMCGVTVEVTKRNGEKIIIMDKGQFKI